MQKEVEELVEECSENFDENEMIYNVVLNDYKNVHSSSTV